MKQVPETKIKLKDAKELMNKGYNLLGELREDVDAPVVKAEFFNESITVIYGEEAARKFYDPENFKREGAMPKPVLKTLFGEDGVQTLDGKAHHHRKNYFMDLMTPERMEEYHQVLAKHLSEALDKQHGEFELFDLANKVLFNAISEWSGINLAKFDKETLEKLAENQISMISSAVTSPTDHMKGISDRKESEKWAQELIKEARKHPVPGKENRALYTFANATDLNGELLPVEVAAVDLLNIIRPTVALTVWVALMGHALFAKEGIYNALQADFANLQDPFIQEMRRYYPFFPMLPAISISDVEIDGYEIPKDSWVVLDVYGTNHDERNLVLPEQFDIERYIGKAKDLSYEEEYEMIAQGGGKFREMHRCAGEWITLHSMRVFSDHLVNKYEFTVPEQDWTIAMNQFPTYPNSKALLFKD
ncbi:MULTISPECIES: cytochrome P450 [Staphylococcus]|uniref:Cytochrome P450 n=1 Tax=Staphylococcus cohnii TaxID=29382 RepID=A0ABT6J222_9STAP|nr:MULTISPECIES: cytochrome P450 [Staphylococcus]EJX16709.1 cytochrome P450 [Staphylococcus sp. OJ82]MBU8681428.1 cytochrome P450 [Staphylococcus saprophyticus]MDH5140492.1 cytochrome P450 [Staphylococcus cohnii]MDH5158813.1 cytochrome P450 [Staphylococcus cohnii]MDH5170076.1 cytochrome P450 [Staphylococcus cohnii]